MTYSKTIAGAVPHIIDKHSGDVYGYFQRQMEMPLITEALKACNNNQSETARVLGICRSTLQKKIAYLGIEPAQPQPTLLQERCERFDAWMKPTTDINSAGDES